jgi:hypothetical protein
MLFRDMDTYFGSGAGTACEGVRQRRVIVLEGKVR